MKCPVKYAPTASDIYFIPPLTPEDLHTFVVPSAWLDKYKIEQRFGVIGIRPKAEKDE